MDKDLELEKKSGKIKKISNEENVYNSYKEKIEDIKSPKSKFFYASIIILNICTLLLAFIWLNMNYDINTFNLLTEVFEYKVLLIVILVFVFMSVLKTIPMLLKFYNNHKRSKFWLFYKVNSLSDFYDSVTLKSSGGKFASVDYMVENGVKVSEAVGLTFSKMLFNVFTSATISLLVLMFSVFTPMKISIWLTLLAIISLLYEISYIVVVVVFAKNKKAGISFVAFISRWLFKFKLIKDYELFFNKTVDKLIVQSKAFGLNKLILITEIASNLLVLVLRVVVLYLALTSVGVNGAEWLWQLIVSFVILDLIIRLLPLQKGTLIIEILFISIFATMFTNVYVFYGLFVYKIFEYFLYAIQYLIVLFIDKICCKRNKNFE